MLACFWLELVMLRWKDDFGIFPDFCCDISCDRTESSIPLLFESRQNSRLWPWDVEANLLYYDARALAGL